MSKVHSIACGFPFCQHSQGQQTNLSIRLRVTAIVVGTIVAIGGILILYGTPGISQLVHTAAWVAISTGGTLVVIGVSIKCIEYEINEKADLQTHEAEDTHIPEATILKLQSSMANILKRKEGDGVKLYTTKKRSLVFALDTAPDFIFKMVPGDNRSIRQRYQKMINANTVYRTLKLGLLVIPQAKLFTVKFAGRDYDIIAEQKLDINPNESVQEQYYEDYADSLNETIRQLAIFICKTGYSDVSWRNNPILNNSLDEYGNRKIALIDIEQMESPEFGLFGAGRRSRGLVRCVNEQQGQIVKTVAVEHRIKTSLFAYVHAQRKKELEDGKKLKQYYSTNQIKGDKAVVINIDSIDFSPYLDEKVERLRKVASDVVNAINEQISSSSPEESIKGRRHIYLDVNNDERFAEMDRRLIIESGEKGYISANKFETDEEYYNATYLGFVANKFIQMRLIYKVIERNGHGYHLQA